MNKLIKQHGVTSDMAYFYLIVSALIVEDEETGFNLFKAMPKKWRVKFLEQATVGYWSSGLSNPVLSTLFPLI